MITPERVAACASVAWFQGVLGDWELETLLPSTTTMTASRDRVLLQLPERPSASKVNNTEDAQLQKHMDARQVLGTSATAASVSAVAVTSWLEHVRAQDRDGNVGLVPPSLRAGARLPPDTRTCLEYFADWHAKKARHE